MILHNFRLVWELRAHCLSARTLRTLCEDRLRYICLVEFWASALHRDHPLQRRNADLTGISQPRLCLVRRGVRRFSERRELDLGRSHGLLAIVLVASFRHVSRVRVLVNSAAYFELVVLLSNIDVGQHFSAHLTIVASIRVLLGSCCTSWSRRVEG